MADATEKQTAKDPLVRIWDELRDLGLEPYIADLDAHGYTVIPPELASPKGFSDRLLQAVVEVAERRNGVQPDLETGSTHAGFKGPFAAAFGSGDSPIGDLMQSLLFEDRIFEEALMNPVLLALASYMCGYGVVMSSMGCFMKGPNESTFALHSDTPLPSPLTPHAVVCNCTYVLTDFNRENGGTAFVPGSHKWCRSPQGDETKVGEDGNQLAVPVECPAGSLLCWHGNTWHGAFNRTAPGLRVSVPVYLARPFIRTQEGLIGVISDEVLERNPARFAILTQQGVVYGYESQKDGMNRAMRAGKFMMAYAKEQGTSMRALASPGLYS